MEIVTAVIRDVPAIIAVTKEIIEDVPEAIAHVKDVIADVKEVFRITEELEKIPVIKSSLFSCFRCV